MLIRCSSLHKIMGKPRTKSEVLTDIAKSYLRELYRLNEFGFDSFDGNKYTEKGNELEDEAIFLSGSIRDNFYIKNEISASNDYLSGTCDILDKENSLVIDTKCSWDIATHPFFIDEAIAKNEKAGYDWQVQGYMFLYELDHAEIDHWLLPCPPMLLGKYDDYHKLVTLVEKIPLSERITTVKYNRDEQKIAQIIEQVKHAQEFYQGLVDEKLMNIKEVE